MNPLDSPIKVILKCPGPDEHGSCTFALVELSFVRVPWGDFSYRIHNEQNRVKALHSARKTLAECVSNELYWLTSARVCDAFERDNSHSRNLRTSQTNVQWRETGYGKSSSVVTLLSFFMKSTEDWHYIRSYQNALELHRDKQQVKAHEISLIASRYIYIRWIVNINLLQFYLEIRKHNTGECHLLHLFLCIYSFYRYPWYQ